MTYSEFLQALEKTPRDWSLGFYGFIRRQTSGGVYQCPISSLANDACQNWYDAAVTIGLLHGAADISAAADHVEGSSPEMRADLLRACGLEAKS